jgi:hypothetical protein
MITEPHTGQQLWTTAPIGQDLAYGDKFSPPWCGKAHQISQMYRQLTLVQDDNSSLMIGFDQLYATEEEAYRAYAQLLRERMKVDRVNLSFTLDKLHKMRARERKQKYRKKIKEAS